MDRIKKLIYRISLLFRNKGLGKRFPILRKMQNKLFESSRKHFIITEGHKMYLDEKDMLGLSLCGDYEEKMVRFMKSQVHEGDTVLDLGANIGHYTLKFSKIVGERGKVYAFEPDPINFKLLELNILINGYKNTIPFQKAVSNKAGKVKFYISNAKSHNLYKCDYHDVITVDSVKLDDFLREKKVDFVKIDIEGAEGEAIKSTDKIIHQNKNIRILFEFKKIIDKTEVSCKELLDYLEGLGFIFFQVNDRFVNKFNKDIPISSKKLLKDYNEGWVKNKEYCTDIFAVRKNNWK